jgi:hypothetical protein
MAKTTSLAPAGAAGSGAGLGLGVGGWAGIGVGGACLSECLREHIGTVTWYDKQFLDAAIGYRLNYRPPLSADIALLADQARSLEVADDKIRGVLEAKRFTLPGESNEDYVRRELQGLVERRYRLVGLAELARVANLSGDEIRGVKTEEELIALIKKRFSENKGCRVNDGPGTPGPYAFLENTDSPDILVAPGSEFTDKQRAKILAVNWMR